MYILNTFPLVSGNTVNSKHIHFLPGTCLGFQSEGGRLLFLHYYKSREAIKNNLFHIQISNPPGEMCSANVRRRYLKLYFEKNLNFCFICQFVGYLL